MDEYIMTYLIVILVIAAGLGLIPASIAKKKGHSFGLWWFYGWMLFIVAIIHVQFITDNNSPQTACSGGNSAGTSAYSPYDRLQKIADLHQSGALSDEEFAKMKADCMAEMK